MPRHRSSKPDTIAAAAAATTKSYGKTRAALKLPTEYLLVTDRNSVLPPMPDPHITTTGRKLYDQAQLIAYGQQCFYYGVKVEPAPAASPAIPSDFLSHREAWRNALLNAQKRARFEADEERVDYWKHELEAFDKAYQQLGAAITTIDRVRQVLVKMLEWGVDPSLLG